MTPTAEKSTRENVEADVPEQDEGLAEAPKSFVDENGNEFRIIHADEAGPESEGVQPVLLEGQRVQVITGEHAGVSGRMAYITGHTFADDAAYLQFHTGGHPKRMFAEVTGYIVETRDGRKEKFSVTPDEIRPLDERNGWGRGSI